MKKTIILSFAALAALFCGCSKADVAKETNTTDEITITIGAGLGDDTRTQFVPEGGKVYWLSGDKIGLRYKKVETSGTKYDNSSLSLVSGAGTQYGVFKGKLSTATMANKNFVIYYPTITSSRIKKSLDNVDDFILEAEFPKIQNNNNILFDANLMYGIAKNVEGWPTSTESNMPIDIKMKNAMTVLDFTVKGTGKIEKMYITDLDETASAMYGFYETTIKNGVVTNISFAETAASEAKRSIEADFNVPVQLTADGAHMYVTVAPRTFAKGIRVVFILTDGDYMAKTIGTNDGFTIAGGTYYTVPTITFASTKTSGKGYAAGVEYSFETITDPRDSEVYRVAELADGRTWMLDNLRYLPESYTPSNAVDKSGKVSEVDAGVWYPVVINETGNGPTFGNADDVKKYGYCYNMSVAMDQDVEWLKNLQKDCYDGKTTQTDAIAEINDVSLTGICPAGYMLPTVDEYENLYKKSGSNLAGLECQGFELTGFGSIVISQITGAGVEATTGTFLGYALNKMNTGYINLAGPVAASVKNGTTTINIFNLKGLMFNRNTNEAKTAMSAVRSGTPIRCIKKKVE